MRRMSSHLYGSGYTSRFPDNTHGYLWRPVLRAVACLPKGARILDPGCGNRYFSNQLYEAGFDVTGVDAEPSGITAARQLWQGVRFEERSVYDDLSGLGEFDGVVSLEVVEHL